MICADLLAGAHREDTNPEILRSSTLHGISCILQIKAPAGEGGFMVVDTE
jgi:hypothetical protein